MSDSWIFNPSPLSQKAGDSAEIHRLKRLFDTDQHGQQIYYDPSHSVDRLVTDHNFLVTDIDGQYLNTNNCSSRIVYGISFGTESRFNGGGVRYDPEVCTTQAAELIALKVALDETKRLSDSREVQILTRVVFCIKSRPFVNRMCNWVWLWARDGWVPGKGDPVANFGMFSHCHHKICELKKDFGVKINVWLTDDIDNAKAVMGQCLKDADFLTLGTWHWCSFWSLVTNFAKKKHLPLVASRAWVS